MSSHVWLRIAHLASWWWTSTAWSARGHARIAEIAQAVLKEKHRAKIAHMLHGNLTDLANWEETMTAKHPETDALHWHRQDPEWTCQGFQAPQSAMGKESNIFHSVTDVLVQRIGDKSGHIRCDGQAAARGSLFCALAFFFEHFAHDALLREFPSPKEPIGTPSELKGLANLKRNELKPHHYLRWLAILIGDSHQPLHWLHDHNYGRDVKVLYAGREHTLLSLWEEVIPNHMPPAMPQHSLEKQYQQQSPAWWDTVPTELFRTWAKEMGEVVCKHVYAPMAGNGTEGNRDIASPFLVSDELFRTWAQLGHDFTTLAGQRLAYVLNEILEHKKHRAAHKEGRGRHHRRKNWRGGLAMNAAISLLVVPSVLLLFRMHREGQLAGLFGHASHRKT